MTQDTLTVRVERHFDFPAEKVFDAWFDSSALGQWFFHAPDGEMKKIEIDPRVGGGFEIAEQRSDGLARHRGEYLVIDRPRKLVFTSDYVGPALDNAPTTTVTAKIAPDGDGCVLTLIHEGVLPGWGDQTKDGWTMILENLDETLGAGAK